MKTTVLTPEQKAKKAAYDKAYRERKKAEAAKATTEVVEATVVEKPKAEKAPKAEKVEKVKAPRAKKERPAKKTVAPELIEMIQPLRDLVENLAADRSTEQMTFIQNELRRLSRVVKKSKNATV